MNDTGTFVAEYHRFSEDEVSDSSMVQVVDVGTTDTGCLDFDEDILGANLGDGPLFNHESRACQPPSRLCELLSTHVFVVGIVNASQNERRVVLLQRSGVC